MSEHKQLKGGSFRTLGLEAQLMYNVPFDCPTPIQRLTLPLILESRSIMGIARTGSGKTLCYLVPAVQRAVEGKNVLILLPTKELVLQVKRIFKRLTYKVALKGEVEITTLKELKTDGVDLLIVDEVDRVLEEKSLAAHFAAIIEGYTGQRVYFSATLPDEPLNIKIVQIENKIPETIRHNFFFVPSDSKDAALLSILDRAKKTIIFVATRYGCDYLTEVLAKHNYTARAIYSSMDDDARQINFDAFLSGSVNFLVVTDVAARGIDIPHLDVSVSYDLSDEKTFVHRVGRIRGMGTQYSFVTYSDVFHFFNIQETHLPDVEIGLIPQDVLDRYDFSDLSHLKFSAMRGYQRCLDFRRKVVVPDNYKERIDRFTLHSRYTKRDTLALQLRQLRAKPVKETGAKAQTASFKDQNYIPYAKKELETHASAFGKMKDDYIRESTKNRSAPRPRRSHKSK
ncbi:ATP-dependent RNA helicase DDX54/DBP10 [Pancytospora philotis]|nr:ATP-dependent RNA helicase DDX54/DBP10 [Pancytospora philotis]